MEVLCIPVGGGMVHLGNIQTRLLSLSFIRESQKAAADAAMENGG